MFKQLTVLALLGAYSITASGQVDADFGIISSSEIALTEVPFDPEAGAVVLLDKGMSDHDGDLNGLLTFRHTRIKVLKKEAIDDMNFQETYWSDNDLEFIDNIKAVVINFDKDGNKTVIPVDKKQIYRRKVDAHTSEVKFAFPSVQVGSIIEYSYRFDAKHYGRLRDWIFQSEYPVVKSSYDLRMVPHVEMTYVVQKKPDYPIVIKPSVQTNSVYFEMNNIPGLGDEPYMASRRENLQMVFFEVSKVAGDMGVRSYMSTWDEVTKHLNAREDFGSQIRAKVSECDDYVRTQLSAASEYDKMNEIYNYVRSNVSWNHEYGIFSDNGIRNTWKKKTGSSGSINLLLINMLKTAGLEVSPMLVVERGHGKVNKERPLINQFNNVFAAVTIAGKQYYLDATNLYEPAYLIPSSILHTTAFIANHKTGGLKVIEAPDETRKKEVITVQASLNDSSIFKGLVNIKSFDYSKSKREEYYAADNTGYADKFYSKAYNVDIEKFKFEHDTLETSALVESFEFKNEAALSADYWLLPINVFTDLKKNPFLEEKRFSEIDFGQKRTVILNYIVNLPANKAVEALGNNIQLVNSDKSLVFSKMVSYVESTHQLVTRIKFEQNKSVYSVGEYPQLKEFFKKMSNILDEQFVIKSK